MRYTWYAQCDHGVQCEAHRRKCQQNQEHIVWQLLGEECQFCCVKRFFFHLLWCLIAVSYLKPIIFSVNFAEAKYLVSVHDQTENIKIVHGNPQLWSDAGRHHNSLCLVERKLQLSIGTAIIFLCNRGTPTVCLTTFPLMKVKSQQSWSKGKDAVNHLDTDPGGFDPSQGLTWGRWRLRGIAVACAQVLLLPNWSLAFK